MTPLSYAMSCPHKLKKKTSTSGAITLPTRRACFAFLKIIQIFKIKKNKITCQILKTCFDKENIKLENKIKMVEKCAPVFLNDGINIKNMASVNLNMNIFVLNPN